MQAELEKMTYRSQVSFLFVHVTMIEAVMLK